MRLRQKKSGGSAKDAQRNRCGKRTKRGSLTPAKRLIGLKLH